MQPYLNKENNEQLKESARFFSLSFKASQSLVSRAVGVKLCFTISSV